MARRQGEAALGWAIVGVLDLQRAGDGLLLQPLAHVALREIEIIRELVRCPRPGLRQPGVEAELIADVDRVDVPDAGDIGQDPFDEGIALGFGRGGSGAMSVVIEIPHGCAAKRQTASRMRAGPTTACSYSVLPLYMGPHICHLSDMAGPSPYGTGCLSAYVHWNHPDRAANAPLAHAELPASASPVVFSPRRRTNAVAMSHLSALDNPLAPARYVPPPSASARPVWRGCWRHASGPFPGR